MTVQESECKQDMAKKAGSIIDLDSMDAATLFRLAQEKELAEKQEKEEAHRERVRALRAEKKAMLKRHASELAEIDREIAALDGKAVRTARAPRRQNGSGTGISQTLLGLIGEQPEMSLDDIRAAIEDRNLEIPNLAQALAYLKRTDRLASPRRGVYSITQS
jgi:hypothetical protein